jgi:uncharacterized membrane protein
MANKLEQVAKTEMKVLEKAETRIDREIASEAEAKHGQKQGDALVEALNLLDHLEKQKSTLERREQGRDHTTFGQRIADKMATFGGSWTFITIFIVVLITWIFVNSMLLLTQPFDPYPFILLNLVLSCIAAIQAPIILMSQNRQADRDRRRDEIDFERDRLDLKVDTLAAKTIHEATVRITSIERQITEINQKLDRMAEKNGAAKRRK